MSRKVTVFWRCDGCGAIARTKPPTGGRSWPRSPEAALPTDWTRPRNGQLPREDRCAACSVPADVVTTARPDVLTAPDFTGAVCLLCGEPEDAHASRLHAFAAGRP